MKDQAEKLRQLAFKKLNSPNQNEKIPRINETRVLSVTSGKGGVGKTNFTINLALSLSDLGYRVVVIDADIGFANIDVILGMMPRYTLADVIRKDMKITEIIEEGPNNIKVIAGGSGIKDITKLSDNKLHYLTNQLLTLDDYADFILIDTGAGLSNVVMNFVNASDELILVTTPEPTSLTDGYAMLKAINNFKTEKYSSKNKVNIVVNRATNKKEADQVFDKLNKVTSRFLDLQLDNLGYIYDSKIVVDSVKKQTPFLINYPNSSVSKRINIMALNLLSNNEYGSSNGLKKFIDNFKSFFNRKGN